jgi:lipopolysaccharide export system permease protein
LILDRHLLRQVATPSFLVFAVLLVIFVGYSLSRFLTQADAGLLTSIEVATLTLLKALIAVEVLLPIGLYFGLLLGLGKLHSDSEIIALHAGGVSELRLLRPVLTLALPLALLIVFLSMYVRPWAYTQTYNMLAIAEASSDVDRISEGQFYLTRKSPVPGEDGIQGPDQERAVFIEKISPQQQLERVFIRTRTGNELQVITSPTGLLLEQESTDFHRLELNDARIVKRVEDGPDLYAQIGDFRIKVPIDAPEPPRYRSKMVASDTLATSTNPKDRAEFQWRLSTSVTTLLLALLAVPLSRSKPRRGKYAKLLMAFVIYAAYYNLIEVNQTWIKQQATLYIWWTPALLASLVLFMYLPWHTFLAAMKGSGNEQG